MSRFLLYFSIGATAFFGYLFYHAVCERDWTTIIMMLIGSAGLFSLYHRFACRCWYARGSLEYMPEMEVTEQRKPPQTLRLVHGKKKADR